MPEPMSKTMTELLDKRMKQCEMMHQEAVRDLKTLRGEAISKHDQTSRAIPKLAKKLEKDPDNKELQKEYSGAVLTRKMHHHAAELNQALLDNEEAETRDAPESDI